MDVNFIGSPQNYAKTLYAKKTIEFKLNNQEQAGLRQQTGISAASSSNTTGVSSLADQMEDFKLNSVISKLKAGRKLSNGELELLREKKPNLYKKAKRIQEERREYENELKRCKSKEDVNRAHLRKKSGLANGVAISDTGSTVDALEDVEMQMNAINDEYSGFVKSNRFHRLPKKQDSLLGQWEKTYEKAKEKAQDLPQQEQNNKALKKSRGKKIII